MRKQIKAMFLSAVFVLASTAAPAMAQAPNAAQQNDGPASTTGQERGAEARTSAEERVENIRQEVEERRAQVKQEVCERRQERLQRLIPKLSQGAVSVQDAMDSIYERIQGFYEDGQLTVDNYEELDGNVATAQSNAAASVEALQEFEFELDCDNPEAGQQLDGFREAAQEARNELKNYRSELVELISSLRDEAAEGDSSEDGSESGDEDDEDENDEEEATDDEA